MLEIANKHKKSMLPNILAFCDILKRAGMDITTGKVIDVCRSLKYIDILNRQDFYYALKANLVSRGEELERFDHLFETFWELTSGTEGLPSLEEGKTEDTSDTCQPEVEDDKRDKEFFMEDWYADGEPRDGLEKKTITTYSPDEVLATKDFCNITMDETQRIQRLIAKLVPKLATAKSRRWHPCSGGHETDPRRTLRRNMTKYGGDIVELAKRERKIRKIKLVLLCDVSGSMDCYSRFLVQFIYGLQNQLKGVETFVFSTRLTRVTPFLKDKKPDDALKALEENVNSWSGGTCIGDSLRVFNNGYGNTMARKTIVIIISDGWDRGNTQIIEEEMQGLRRRSYRIIWLNPLLGNPNYRPMTKGMQAALPFIDYFLPSHNIDSLINLGKTLKSLCK